MTRPKSIAFTLSIILCPGAILAQEPTPSAIFEAAAPSVFQVLAPFAQGSGFLVDGRGLILTSAHVVRGTERPDVKISPTLKFPSVVAAVDQNRDLAILRVHPSVISDLTPIPLAIPSRVSVGETVFALGYPLHRGVVFTTGIVSYVDESTLISDVNSNPGNSGGPLLDSRGRAVGVSTYLAATGAGPGLSGAVTGGPALRDLLSSAEASLSDEAPAADSLPVLPLESFPLSALRRAAEASEWPVDLYDITETGSSVEGYDVEVFTPPLLYHLQTRAERYRRGDQEIRLGDDLYAWALELGGFPPVVIVRITPEVGSSTESFVANLFLGVVSGLTSTPFSPVMDLEFQGDLRGVTVQGNGETITPIRVAFTYQRLGQEAAQAGYLVLSAELFRPRPEGLAEVIINVRRADGALLPWVIPIQTMERIAEDFAPYFESAR